MKAKILFYNTQTGQGKLILESEKRMDFSAELWSDFDTFPVPGVTVVCELNHGVLTGIKAEKNVRQSNKVRLRGNDEDPVYDDSSLGRDTVSGIEATFTVVETIQSYFKPIDVLMGKPPKVLNTNEQLNFFLIKRFLLTAYNDLKGLDASIHNNSEIKRLLDELQQFQKAYYTVETRLNAPRLAFEIIFLRSQPEYLRFIRHKEQCLNRISILSHMEESLFPDLQKKEEELKKIPFTETKERLALEKELKTMRRYYVDTIHENASLSEELSSLEDLRELYTNKYLEPFTLELLRQGGQYQDMLVRILNYRAFKLDKLIWAYAAQSKMIQEFFATSHIEGNYSTLTFLKYHLNTLDKSKINEEQKELFELLEYLEESSKS